MVLNIKQNKTNKIVGSTKMSLKFLGYKRLKVLYMIIIYNIFLVAHIISLQVKPVYFRDCVP